MPASNYLTIQDDEDSDQDAVAKQSDSLSASTQKLRDQKLAEAKQKMAEAKKKMAEAQARIEAQIHDREDGQAIAAAAKDMADAARTQASTQALIETSSRSSRSHGSSSDSATDFIVPVVGIVFVFGWLTVKTVVNAWAQRSTNQRAASSGGGGMRLSEEEQAVLGRLQHTLADMESRVEALETILIDHRRPTKENYESKL